MFYPKLYRFIRRPILERGKIDLGDYPWFRIVSLFSDSMAFAVNAADAVEPIWRVFRVDKAVGELLFVVKPPISTTIYLQPQSIRKDSL